MSDDSEAVFPGEDDPYGDTMPNPMAEDPYGDTMPSPMAEDPYGGDTSLEEIWEDANQNDVPDILEGGESDWITDPNESEWQGESENPWDNPNALYDPDSGEPQFPGVELDEGFNEAPPAYDENDPSTSDA